MDEKELEKAFIRVKNELPVNQALKQELRQKYVKQRKRGLVRSFYLAVAAAAVACLIFTAYLLTPNSVIERASAASLKIYNQISFLEIGGGGNLGVSEHNGTVYMPVAGKGLFSYDQKGFHKLVDHEVTSVRVSNDGKKLAYSSKGNLAVYDIASKRSEILLQGDDKNNVYYEEPAWSPDGSRVIYTKKVYEANPTHGFNEKDAVYELNLNNRESRMLVSGSHASYTAGTDMIVFTRDRKVVAKNLKESKEVVIDSGRFPTVSPDGSYVAYVKTEHSEREVGSNGKVAEDIDNVWIVDAQDFKTKKRVTSNFAWQFTDVNQWIKSLKPSKIPQVLALSGRYSYYEPVWSSDSDSLYVLKNINAENGGRMRLVRVDFTTRQQGAVDTVKKFVQALVVRDDDYAKSLMKNPPAFLTVSNPRQVGYKITGSGKANGRDYVDAEMYSEYTANPYFNVTKARFHLSPGSNGFIIDKVDAGESIGVSADDRNNAVYITRNQKKELLFRDSDIPHQYAVQGKHRFASLAYSTHTNTLVFTIQALQDAGQKASVKVLSYNLKTRQFRLIDHITTIANKVNIGVGNLILDNQGRYAALDLFSDDDKNFTSYCVVYNMEDNKKTDLNSMFNDTDIDGVHTSFWDEGRLVFNLTSHEQTMVYSYVPGELAVRSISEK